MTQRVLNIFMASAVSAALFAAFAPAGAADPSEQVKTRQEEMKRLGGSMQTVARFLKQEGATAEDVQRAATTIADVARAEPAAVFPQGTAAPVADSHARPELWKDWDRTQQLWAAMQPAASRLAEAAGTGDRARIAQAQQAVGQTCSNCHEHYRIKKD